MEQGQAKRTPLLNILSMLGLIGLPMAAMVMILGAVKFRPVFVQLNSPLPLLTTLIMKHSVWWALSGIAALNTAAMIVVSCLRKERLLLVMSIISVSLAAALLISTFVGLALPMRMVILKTQNHIYVPLKGIEDTMSY